MLKKIPPHCFFYVGLRYSPPHFLGYSSFVNTTERSSLYQLTALKMILFAPRNPWHQLSFILKFINSSFLRNMNFPFEQSSCFYNLFLSLKLASYNHFNYKAKRETELKNFFSLIFQRLKHDIWPCWCHQRSSEAGSGTWILSKPNKVISILTETHINHDQIHHARNNWLGSIFLSPRYSHTKGMLVVLHLGLEGIRGCYWSWKGLCVL